MPSKSHDELKTEMEIIQQQIVEDKKNKCAQALKKENCLCEEFSITAGTLKYSLPERRKKMARLTFINHAGYVIETNNTLLIADPWVEGGAFDNGWSLLDKSITNKMLVEYLIQTDKAIFIWLSHEHSDHFSVPFLKAL